MCVCVRQKQWQEHGGRHCLHPRPCVSPSGDSRVSGSLALWSRWPSQLLPGSPGSQHSLTRAGVLTAWGPTDLLLWPGLWGLWGLLGALGSPSRDSQDNRSVFTQLPPTTYQSSEHTQKHSLTVAFGLAVLDHSW